MNNENTLSTKSAQFLNEMKGGHTATQNRTRKNTRWSHTIQVRITHGSRHTSFSTNTTAFHFVLAILTHEVGVIEAVIARAIVEIVAATVLVSSLSSHGTN